MVREECARLRKPIGPSGTGLSSFEFSVIVAKDFFLQKPLDAMVTRDGGMPNGWPFGLEIVNIRLRVADGLQAAAAEPHSLHLPSTSFSSFSSSNLDTEIYQSTASFFQDRSVSLGRLIGIRPGDGGGLYFPKSIEEHGKISVRGAHSDESEGCRAEMSWGICTPLLLCILVRLNRSKSNSKR